uniref:rhomboid protease n=1 Tax=Panagrellus redivivus TaxID=6233 RepID=A0A7E4VFT1_PANRE
MLSRLIHAKSAFKASSSKLISTTVQWQARFTRDGLRQRLKQPIRSETKKPPTFDNRPDAIPVRPVSDLWKALGFTVVIGSTAYAAAAIILYERERRKIKDIFRQMNFAGLFSVPEQTDLLSTPGIKWALAVIGLNAGVFLAWRVPALNAVMWRFFSNSYASKSLCSPMLLSCFSHYSAIHLALNMYVLFSFVPPAINKFLGLEQFTAFYLTAGVVSSLASLAHKAITRSPFRALGASGAILGAIVYTCMKIPDARLSIIFLPMFTFSAEHAVYGLMAFDLAGLLLGFRMFDHAAHLGGAVFGLWYALYGEKFYLQVIQPRVIETYKSIRGPPTAF